MQRPALLVVITATLPAPALAAAAPATSGPQARAAKTTVVVTADEYSFKFAPARPKAGRVTFRITNSGRVNHDLRIAGKTSKLIKPGKRATLTVSLRKGSHAYVCTVRGHEAAGMRGRLRVT